MAEQAGEDSATGVINPNPPKKSELVERALSDGMTDPAEIAAWAKTYGLSMTADEVQQLTADIKTSSAADEGGRS